MNCEADKMAIMEKLRSLKGKDKYKRVSVTDDHTSNERQLIKNMVEKLKEANGKEPADSQFVWKLRETPKNGLGMKRFRKRNEGQGL